jgi:RimJ/RimL family protein N-acetyltransferase
MNSFQNFVYKLQNSKFSSCCLISFEDKKEISFYPLTFNCLNSKHISRLKKWRQINKKFFSSKNYITTKSTANYIKKYLNSKRLRILFYIKYNNTFIGHFELTNYSKNNKNIEITYILRGVRKYKGIMSSAIYSFSKFLELHFKFKNIFIKVKKDNLHAIRFYKKNCYKIYKSNKEILVFRFNYKKEKNFKFKIKTIK